MAGNVKTLLVILLMMVGGCVACGLIINSGPHTPDTSSTVTAADKTKAAEVVRIAREGGILDRIEGYDAWVNPVYWAQMDYQTKVGTTRMFAIYADHTVFHVRDNMTGKELASYSQSWGVTIK